VGEIYYAYIMKQSTAVGGETDGHEQPLPRRMISLESQGARIWCRRGGGSSRSQQQQQQQQQSLSRTRNDLDQRREALCIQARTLASCRCKKACACHTNVPNSRLHKRLQSNGRLRIKHRQGVSFFWSSARASIRCKSERGPIRTNDRHGSRLVGIMVGVDEHALLVGHLLRRRLIRRRLILTHTGSGTKQEAKERTKGMARPAARQRRGGCGVRGRGH